MKIKNIDVHIILLLAICMLLLMPSLVRAKSANIPATKISGKYLFRYYNCINCHVTNGIGGTLGPSLSGYGKWGKDYRWTITQIKNPQSHFKIGSEIKINGKMYYVLMPPYNYMPNRDVKSLTSYLESLKKR